MRFHALAATLCLAMLTGCGVNPTAPGTTSNALNLSGNWQVQSLNTTTGAANAVLRGALTSSGSQVTGTFSLTNTGAYNVCANQIFTATGTLDANQNLTLTSAIPAGGTVTATLAFSALVPGYATGSIQVVGGPCVLPSASAAALEYANATGTFAGALTPTANVAPNFSIAGNGSLKLTQAATPSTDGTFAVTGTLTYTTGTCSSTAALTGTSSGPVLSLTTGTAASVPNYTTIGAVNLPINSTLAPQLQPVNIFFFPAPCAPGMGTGSLSGPLLKQ